MIALAFGLSAWGADPHWVGLPLERLESVGLLSPTAGPQSLRYPLREGGLVSLYITAGPSEAGVVFEGLQRTGATFWPPVAISIQSDRQLGDGQAVALVQLDNVVLMVRSNSGEAAAVVERIRTALTADPAACAGLSRTEPDGAQLDRCGNRLP